MSNKKEAFRLPYDPIVAKQGTTVALQRFVLSNLRLQTHKSCLFRVSAQVQYAKHTLAAPAQKARLLSERGNRNLRTHFGLVLGSFGLLLSALQSQLLAQQASASSERSRVI